MKALCFVLFLALPSWADDVELVGGEIIRDCKVVVEGDTYKISKGGVTRTVSKDSVKSWTKKPTREETFNEKLAAATDLAGFLDAAKWAIDVGIKPDAAYLKVIALDPDHAEARKALGYTKVGDKWMTADEVKISQGYVKHKGRWVTPEERDLDLAIEAQKEVDKKYLSQLKNLTEKIGLSDEKKRDEAIKALAELDDAMKPKIFLAFAHSDSKNLRLFVATELGRLAKETKALGVETEIKAIKALARRTIWDEVDGIRDAAFKSLIQINHPDTAVGLMIYLGEESRIARMRTCSRLEYFKDLRPAPQLLELVESCRDLLKVLEANKNSIAKFLEGALITRDGRRIPMPKNIRFLPSIFDEHTKENVEEERTYYLSALRALTGQDFGDNVEKWAAWLQTQKK